MPVAAGATFWGEDRLAQLRTFAAAGFTARAIAGALGCTRNAVISKAHREGRLLAKQDNRTPAQRRAERLAYMRDRYAALRAANLLPYRPRPSKQTLPAPEPRRLALVELGIDMCHWPVTDDHPFCFCGNDTAGHVYCPFHHTLGIDKNQGKRPSRIYVF